MRILIISPGFIPLANVSKMRMSSLVRYLWNRNEITVIQSRISSYSEVTDEKPLDQVRTIEANVKGRFISDYRAFKKAVKTELREQKYDIALISVGPYYTLLLTRSIRKRNVPVVVDYRDLWTDTHRKNIKIQGIKEALKKAIERKCLAYINGFIAVDETSVSVLREHYAFLKGIRSDYIYNGYDDTELSNIKCHSVKNTSNTELTIGIYGKFSYYLSREEIKWFAGEIEEFCRIKRKKIRFIHYGEREDYFESLLKDAGIDYDYRGFVEYCKGMSGLSGEADFLLASHDLSIGYGTKVFDYIYLNKPILMYAVEGSDLKAFISKFQNGYVFSNASELNDILSKLDKLGSRKLDENINVEEYSRTRQNKKFERIIKEVICDQNMR